MFAIMSSVFNVVLGFVFRSLIVKFVLFFGLFFITTEFIQILVNSNLLPSASALTGAFGGIPSGIWYFLDLFNFSMGFSTILSAFVSRFIIRRLPVIG